MRIITGKYKGRTLIAPKSAARPTLDRAKETLFNILRNFEGAVVLDLFAGSGQLALESLSRGASKAYLCDNSKEACAAIRSNFAKVGEQPLLFCCSWKQCLQQLQNAGVTIAFVDPPYGSGVYTAVLEQLCQLNVVQQGAIVVCEHAAQSPLPQQVAQFEQYDTRKVGTVCFSFFRRTQ